MTAVAPPRPEIFDVTIRDGSYVIDFQFRPEDVRLLYGALDRIGMPYIEIGHGLGLNASPSRGAAAGSDDEYLAAAAESCKQSRFGTFFIPGIGDQQALRRARGQYGMHFVRLGNDPEKIEAVLPFLECGKELGLEVMVNFMKSYSMPAAELARKAAMLARHGADAVYVVDSAGGMLPDEVAEYVRAIAESCPARIGFHGHNNLELAIANTVAAWRSGATLLDCSIGGLGRSSGNTRTELLIPVLRALGVSLPYDFQEVLRLWQEVLRPILQKRPLPASEVVGGYARIHSGMMGPVLETARRHRVSVESLLEAHGDAHYGLRPRASLDRLALELAARPRESPAENGSLLRMQPGVTDPCSLRNTFRSVDEVLKATGVLSRKAFLPVVALVSIEPAGLDEDYVMAEYLYHDEHFIVLRAVFSSVALFTQVMQKHRGRFNILAFERASESLRRELAERKDEWHADERVVFLRLVAAKYHYLFSLLHQVAGAINAHRVLFFGADPERIAEFAGPAAGQLELYCTTPSAEALHRVGIRAVQPQRRSTKRSRFDLAVLTSPISGPELEAVLGSLAPTGVVIDCLEQAAAHPDVLRGASQRVVPVSLYRAVSGELLGLLASDPCQAGGVPMLDFPAAEPGMENVYERRAA